MYRFCRVIAMAAHLTYVEFLQDSEVLPLTQKYQTQQKDFDSTMPDDASMCIMLRLNQVNLNNVTCIYTSICSIMFYYFGGDFKYE